MCLYFVNLSIIILPISDVGCDCDETAPNPDELCPSNFQCKQCKCLAPGNISLRICQKQTNIQLKFDKYLFLQGCDCDPSAPFPNDFCQANEECKQCKCLRKGKSLEKANNRHEYSCLENQTKNKRKHGGHKNFRQSWMAWTVRQGCAQSFLVPSLLSESYHQSCHQPTQSSLKKWHVPTQ